MCFMTRNNSKNRTRLFHRLKERQHHPVSVRLHLLSELLHVQTRYPGELRRLLEHLHHEVLQRRRRGLAPQHTLVQHGRIVHQALLAHASRLSSPRHPRHEVHKVTLRSSRCLPDGVYRRPRRKHSLLQAKRLVVTEQLRHLIYVANSVLAEVLAQRNVDLVRRFNPNRSLENLTFILLKTH